MSAKTAEQALGRLITAALRLLSGMELHCFAELAGRLDSGPYRLAINYQRRGIPHG